MRTDHEGDIDGSAAIDDETLAFNSTTCTVLNPEGEVGPFYVLGEYVRSDLTEDETGVPVVADIQFIDVSTCEPLSGVCEFFATFLPHVILYNLEPFPRIFFLYTLTTERARDCHENN